MATVGAPLGDRAAVEAFHLAFLRTLVAAPDKKAHIAVKGGCNLRFFFASPRYSEGIDLDVAVIATRTLKTNVDKLLAGNALGVQLRALGLAIVTTSAPKQTETTQRWKIELAGARGARLRTKIEFSRRANEDVASADAVDATLLARYRLGPVVARHYVADAAIVQKIRALAGRAETQARDVFDLALLITRSGDSLPNSGTLGGVLDDAAQCALSLGYDEYAGQVLAYLDPEQRELYEGRAAWEQMQLAVVDALARMAP